MQWVLRAQCRDRDALEALLRGIQAPLRRYLSRVAGVTDGVRFSGTACCDDIGPD